MSIHILRDGLRERLGSAGLAPRRLPIEAELSALRERLARITSRAEIRTDVVARAELLQMIAGTLEDIKVAMLAGATDMSPAEIAEACRVDVQATPGSAA